MNFSPSTTVEKIEENDFMILNHKFEFVDLGDLSGIVTSYTNPEFPEFFVDVIGMIEEFQGLSDIKTVYGDRNTARFCLTDGRHSPPVSIWGQHVIDIEAQMKTMKETPVITILASTKLTTYRV
ncbi:hypothetical protein ACET3Z_001352 [Daucus carota]